MTIKIYILRKDNKFMEEKCILFIKIVFSIEKMYTFYIKNLLFFIHAFLFCFEENILFLKVFF
jgi:hypothetical protein